jgi:hypothetical protein
VFLNLALECAVGLLPVIEEEDALWGFQNTTEDILHLERLSSRLYPLCNQIRDGLENYLVLEGQEGYWPVQTRLFRQIDTANFAWNKTAPLDPGPQFGQILLKRNLIGIIEAPKIALVCGVPTCRNTTPGKFQILV